MTDRSSLCSSLQVARLLRRGAGLLGLLALLCALGACRSAPDKRLLQYLNEDGFGRRYKGNAEQENYVTLGDGVTWVDAVNAANRGTGKVDIDGTIIVPECGAVSVAGFTRSEIEALLTQKLAPYYQRTEIQVQITTKAKTYYVFGEIAQVGAKPLPGDWTIFDAVMTSGPKDHTANLGRVKLIRADPQDPFVSVLNVADMLRTGDSTFNVLIQENDIVIVPPTLLAQVGYFIGDLVTPFTTVFATVFQSLFAINNFNNFGKFNNNGIF
jgi:protein involved in polysaccharide export with SLBB domain